MTFEHRIDALRDLIAAKEPLPETFSRLKTFPWDSDRTLVDLERSDVIRVLRRYLQERLSAEKCGEWADAIEARDDVGFEPQHTDLLKRVIFDIANPELSGQLSHEAARDWITLLENAGHTEANPGSVSGDGDTPSDGP